MWPGSATHINCWYWRHDNGPGTFPFFNLFYFIFFVQQRPCSEGSYILISPSPRSHLTDEVGLAAGRQSARRSWLMGRLTARRWWGGPAAAAARDDMMKLGSCPSLLHKRIQKCHCNKQTGSVTYLSHTSKHQHINQLIDQSFNHKHRRSQGVVETDTPLRRELKFCWA